MKNKSILPIMMILLLLLFICNCFSVKIRADSLNAQVYSTNEAPFGVQYSEWIGRWWNWTASMNATEHPRDDDTRPCDVKQIWDDVWFLPDSLTGQHSRECEVPLGKAIFVPISTGEDDNSANEAFRNKPLNEVRNGIIASARECQNHIMKLGAEIDGKKLLGFEKDFPYRTNTTDLFNISWEADNIYQITPNRGIGFADGWFLFVKPLPQGDHEITIYSKIVHPTKGPICNTDSSVTWNLKVK